MAARRFVKSSIDWAAFAERVPPSQKIQFQSFKAKVDGYAKQLMSFPEKPPAIDFAAYRQRLPHLAMVSEFEKEYQKVSVPYPADKLTASVNEQEKKVDEQIKLVKELSELTIQAINKQLQWWKDMLPIEEMSMEEYHTYFPDPKLNPYERPNFWPFTEEPRPVFPYLDKKPHH